MPVPVSSTINTLKGIAAMINIYTPYTYLIGWSGHQTYYYGVRFSKKCHPSDLWKTYFTSSKYVKQFRETYGEPDIIQIRKTFKDSKSAILWEEKVLKRINAIENKKWLNRSIAGNWKTSESIPNPLKGKTYEEVYGEEKAINWNNKRREGNLRWWKSKEGKKYREKLSEKNFTLLSKKFHVFQTHENCKNINKKRIENGTHNFLGSTLNKKRIEDGTHNFLGSTLNKKRIEDGTHNLIGRVPCIDKNGNFVSVSKEEFQNQSGNKTTWDFVHVTSKEGRRRKSPPSLT